MSKEGEEKGKRGAGEYGCAHLSDPQKIQKIAKGDWAGPRPGPRLGPGAGPKPGQVCSGLGLGRGEARARVRKATDWALVSLELAWAQMEAGRVFA